MKFPFCVWQILLVWSHWAWSPGKFPQSRLVPPHSTTPTGRLNARDSTTTRTAGRPQTTLSGSGYRSEMFGYVTVKEISFFMESSRSHTGLKKNRNYVTLVSFSSLISKWTYAHSLVEKQCLSIWSWLHRWDLAHIWSEYCSLICTTSLHVIETRDEKKKKESTCIIY